MMSVEGFVYNRHSKSVAIILLEEAGILSRGKRGRLPSAKMALEVGQADCNKEWIDSQP